MCGWARCYAHSIQEESIVLASLANRTGETRAVTACRAKLLVVAFTDVARLIRIQDTLERSDALAIERTNSIPCKMWWTCLHTTSTCGAGIQVLVLTTPQAVLLGSTLSTIEAIVFCTATRFVHVRALDNGAATTVDSLGAATNAFNKEPIRTTRQTPEVPRSRE